MGDFFSYVANNWSTILERTGEHIGLAFTAVLLSCVVGIPVGLAITRNRKLAGTVVNIANVIQTIPSLAMFAIVIPLLGVGAENAIFALFLYGLLPIIKNTYIGIRNVDPSVIEAAKGMGMSRSQILFKVQTPIAVPVIMGGVRIATVTGIGVATVATLIGAGGLGTLIYQGIGMYNYPMMFSGAIPAALLALIADFGLGVFERSLTSKGIAIKQ